MDVRVARTRRRLQEALFALARERGFDQVSVSDIADFAGVNRSTFYQHYSDKATVLADALDALAIQAGVQLESITDWTREPPLPLVVFLEHIEVNAEVYRQVFSDPGSGVVLARLRAQVNAAVHDVVAKQGDAAIPVDMVAAGVAGTVLGVMGAWLAREPLPSAQQAAAWIWGAILGPSHEVLASRGTRDV